MIQRQVWIGWVGVEESFNGGNILLQTGDGDSQTRVVLTLGDSQKLRDQLCHIEGVIEDKKKAKG